MKTLKTITLIIILISTMNCMAQKKDIQAIEKTITAFSEAGDKNDAAKLSTLLDENYRVVMNRLFGSDKVSVVNRSTYIEKIKTKEWGGDQRTLTIENIAINGNNASVKVTFKGKKATFISFMILVKDKGNNWKLISDIPMIK